MTDMRRVPTTLLDYGAKMMSSVQISARSFARVMNMTKSIFVRGILVFALSTGFLHAEQPSPSQERIDSFYKDLNAAEAESKTAKPASKETIAFLEGYLADPKEFPGPIERARAALTLFRIDPESKVAQKNLVELMSFIRESDDARPDYLGIFKGLEEMGQRAHPICGSFHVDTLNRWHPDRKRAIKLFHNLCEHKNRK